MNTLLLLLALALQPVHRSALTPAFVWPQAAQEHQVPDAGNVYRPGPGVEMPKLLRQTEAPYSDEAARRRLTGDARVQVVVDATGHVRDARIVRSIAESYSDPADHEAALTLDQNALAAVKQYAFTPGRFQGQPVAVYAMIEVSFHVAQEGQRGPSTDDHKIYTQGPGVVMPRALHTVDASYSEEARKRRVSGEATVEVIVDENGRVQQPRIVKSVAEGYSNDKDRKAALGLDQQAIEAVKQYTFVPGRFHDQPVAVLIKIEMSFRLR